MNLATKALRKTENRPRSPKLACAFFGFGCGCDGLRVSAAALLIPTAAIGIFLLAGASAAVAGQATLVETIETSQFGSPDPAGITYIASSDSLLISDSEVDEMLALFTGDNLFEITLSGFLLNAFSTLSFPSAEPTGVTFKPSNGHLFFSDDDAKKIFELDPGPDGFYYTSDDIVTSFDTRDFLSFDPEGIAAADISVAETVCSVSTKDAYFREDAPDHNFGSRSDFEVKPDAGTRHHSVVEFDLSAIPADSEIVSSFLQLWEENERDDQTIHVHRVTSGWVESEVSWDQRSAGIPWTTPGGDFDATVLGSFEPNVDEEDREVDVTGATRDWVDGAFANYGLLLRSTGANGEVRFKSREEGDEEKRPLLCVTYESAPERGALFIANGEINPEVFRVTPGSNGFFDGVPPLGDDVATSFDVGSDGFTDIEGIAFNSANGHLYVVGKPSTSLGEYTIDGTLVRTLDISAANPRKPAGLTFAPGSSDPSVMNIYIADRRIDNNQDPNENDGQVYEMSLPGVTPNNEAPTTDAGSDQTISLGDGVALNGTVLDDGLPNPPGVVTTTWRQVSGPGTVGFTDAVAVDTAASFSSAGTYVLRLAANDDGWVTSDDVTITVLGTGGESVAEVRVASGSDDAEERLSGDMRTTSNDLAMVLTDSNEHSYVGLRFEGVAVPRRSEIVKAYVQFQADESHDVPTFLAIQGEAADDAASFETTDFNLSDRPKTVAAVDWGTYPGQSIPEWVRGEAGPDQQTSDISAVIQEIVNGPGWYSGNALALFISSQVSGQGRRVAESADGHPAAALLHVEYIEPIFPEPPCSVVGEGELTIGGRGKELKWRITNTDGSTVTIDSITIGWPESVNGALREAKLGRPKIFNRDVSSPALIDAFIGKASQKHGKASQKHGKASLKHGRVSTRQLDPGEHQQLKFKFANKIDTSQSAYSIQVEFAEGCSLNF